MNELLQKYIQNGLADFEGLEITGHIPVTQELINSLIADALKPDPTPAPAADADVPTPAETAVAEVVAPPTKKKSLDRKALINLVKGMVQRAKVKAVEGAIVLEFELRR